jgi:hypothetical protein
MNKITKLNLEPMNTSTDSGLKKKIAQLTKLLKQGKFKGAKEVTAKRNLSWYRSKLKSGGRKPRKSVSARSKKKRSR